MSNLNSDQHPISQGKYNIATRTGNKIYTSGMTPRENGVLIFKGKVTQEKPVSHYRDAVILATKNALNAAKSQLIDSEILSQAVSLTVYINATDTFENHAELADFASQYLIDEMGNEFIGSRAAIGVSSLPGNASIEIQLIAVI